MGQPPISHPSEAISSVNVHPPNLLSKWCDRPWPSVVFELKKGQILYANSAAADLFRYPLEELVGTNFEDLFKETSVPEFRKLLATNSLGRCEVGGVWQQKTKDDTALLVELEGTCLLHQEERVCLLTINNIAEPRNFSLRIEKEVQTDYESIFNYAVDGIYQSTPEGRLLSANPAFARLLGYNDADEAIRALYPLATKLYVDPHRRVFLRKILDEHGLAHDLEFEAYRKDGSRIWLSFNARSVKNSQGETLYYEGFIQDITSQKRLETRLEKALQDLKRSNDELQRFAYIASHDLREPLRTVTSYVTLLKNRYENLLDDSAKEYINFAVTGVQRMKQLISDLLAYSSLERSHRNFSTIPLGPVLQNVVQDLLSSITLTQAKIETGVFPTLSCDEAQMRQLFSNLIVNSLKYRTERELQIQLRCTEQANHFLFEIEDNGQGFEERFSTCIFEPFRRLHGPEFEGTGMGLAICKRIVERHGGSIWATSRPGEGAIFSFVLPRHGMPESA